MPRPTLCNTFRKEAGNVWNRMRTAARLGLSLSEETLTECALYNIALAHPTGDILIDLATKPAENRHGADWEWWFLRGHKGLGFRIQAKRLFPNGCYNSLTSSGKKPYSQLDTLVAAAAREDLEPLYCFYNFSHPQGRFNASNTCLHSYRIPSFWGCTLAFPAQVKRAQSKQLNALRPLMHPWHTLVCDAAALDLLGAANQFISDCGGADAGRRPRAPHELPDLSNWPTSDAKRTHLFIWMTLIGAA